MVKFSKTFPCFPSSMDGNSSDNSHSCSEIGGEMWTQVWEHELNLSGLNLGNNSPGLQGLVDDKEIAARAVAFVVSSTRKGIVPLCADIASLLRAKQCLEKKILMLRNENALLRSSASGSVRTSQSASPIPASLNSYDKSHYNNDSLQNGDRPSRPCSRCSQCSSTLSNSPKLEKGQGFITNDLQPSPLGSDLGPEVTTSTPTKPENGILTEAIVHVKVRDEVNSKLRVTESSRSKGESSLPEITAEPNGDARKIRPSRKMVSRETQCSINRKREQAAEAKKDGDKTISEKEKALTEDLGAARKEIELLKARLKELEASKTGGQMSKSEGQMSQNGAQTSQNQGQISQNGAQASQNQGQMSQNGVKTSQNQDQVSLSGGEPKYYVENELAEQSPVSSRKTDKPSTAPKPRRTGSQSSSTSGLLKPKAPPKQLRLASISQPLNSQHAPVDFLPGCKCEQCQLTSGDGGELFPLNEAKKPAEPHKIRINSKLEVKVGDHVLTKDDTSGYIRYIGHVDRSGQPNTIYAGLSLDAPKGQCDGFIHGKRYFLCHRDLGVFVPLEDIVCALPSKETKKGSLTAGAVTTEENKKVDKSGGKSSKKSPSGSQSHTKLGDKLTLMLQKSRKVSDQSHSNSAAGKGGTDEGPISTSSPTKPSPRGDKQWLAPYTEVGHSSREGPVV